jgi:hypothetical protein
MGMLLFPDLAELVDPHQTPLVTVRTVSHLIAEIRIFELIANVAVPMMSRETSGASGLYALRQLGSTEPTDHVRDDPDETGPAPLDRLGDQNFNRRQIGDFGPNPFSSNLGRQFWSERNKQNGFRQNVHLFPGVLCAVVTELRIKRAVCYLDPVSPKGRLGHQYTV